MKVFITQWATTAGIIESEIEALPEPGRCLRYRDAFLTSTHYTPDFALAKSRAERMRFDRIASLKKQIAKLEALDFLTARKEGGK